MVTGEDLRRLCVFEGSVPPHPILRRPEQRLFDLLYFNVFHDFDVKLRPLFASGKVSAAMKTHGAGFHLVKDEHEQKSCDTCLFRFLLSGSGSTRSRSCHSKMLGLGVVKVNSEDDTLIYHYFSRVLSSAALLQNSVFMYMQLMVLARSYHLKMCSVDVSMQIIGLVVNILNVHSHDFSYLKCIFQLSIVEERAAQSPDAHITHLTSPNPSMNQYLVLCYKIRRSSSRISSHQGPTGLWPARRWLFHAFQVRSFALREAARAICPCVFLGFVLSRCKPFGHWSGVWYVHERQQEGGRPLPWLFFNASSGKYYRRVHGTTGISFAA